MNTATQLLTGGALAAIAAAVAIPALSGAQAPTTRDITVRDKARSVTFVHAKPSTRGERLATGDRVLTRQAMFDTSNAAIGTLFTDCTNLGRAAAVFKATLQCTTTYRFRDGQVIAVGVLEFAKAKPGARFPIVGGSGAYRSARGEIEVGAPVKAYNSVDILHVEG